MFSIITSSYNSEETISDTINSLLDQTSSNFECIFIDGNSKDGTCDIIRKHIVKFNDKGINVQLISEDDKGIYDAWNKGIDLANGEFISFLNSDDFFEIDAIEKVDEYLKTIKFKNNSFGIVGTLFYCDNDKKVIKKRKKSKLWKYVYRYKMPFNFPGLFLKSEVYKKLNKFNDTFKLSGDYDFIVRAIDHGTMFYLFDSHIINMRNQGATYSPKNIKIGRSEDLKIWKKFGIGIYVPAFCRKLIINILSTLKRKLKYK